jgi:hypothetical protein
MKRKPDIDRQVAMELGVPLATVRSITRAFVDYLALALRDEGGVDLQGFGILQVRILRTPSGYLSLQTSDGKLDKIYVTFTKKPSLKRELDARYKKGK